MERENKFVEAIQPCLAVKQPVLTVRAEAGYAHTVALLNELLYEVGDDAAHPQVAVQRPPDPYIGRALRRVAGRPHLAPGGPFIITL